MTVPADLYGSGQPPGATPEAGHAESGPPPLPESPEPNSQTNSKQDSPTGRTDSTHRRPASPSALGIWIGRTDSEAADAAISLPEKGAPLPPLRRKVSVLAEAAAERRRIGPRLRCAARKVFDLLSFATDGIAPLLRKFEALPRRRQFLLVLAPYLGALALLLFWLGGSSAVVRYAASTGEGGVAGAGAPAQPVAMGLAATTAGFRPVSPADDAARSAVSRAAPTNAGALPSAQPSGLPRSSTLADRGARPEVDASARVLGRARVLPRASALYSRPTAEAHRAASLRNGHMVTVYEGFPAPEGWILARSEKGTVGFMSTLHLDGERDPRIDRHRRRKRRKR